jgi:DNA-binding beta-propeller fold protein YncE
VFGAGGIRMSTAILGFLVSLIALSFAATSAQATITHKYLTQITEGEHFEPFVKPWGLTFDSEGNLYVADAEGPGETAGHVDVFNSSNAFLATLDNETVAFSEPEPLREPPFSNSFVSGPFVRSVAVNEKTGVLYVAESECDCLQVLKPKKSGEPKEGYERVAVWTGLNTKKSKATGQSDGSFGRHLVYVAVNNTSGADAGDVYVLTTGAENEVLYMIAPGAENAEGAPIEQLNLKEHLSGAPNNETGVVVSPLTGDVYVASNETDAVDAYNGHLEEIGELRPPKLAHPFTPVAVAVDPGTGEVYAVDQANHVVDQFSPAAKFEGPIEDTEATPGSPLPLQEPLGVAVNASGLVYVSDGATKAVDVFAAEPPSAPQVESESVLQITDSSATLEAQLDPRSLKADKPTTYRFQYSTEPIAVCAATHTCTETPAASLAPSFEVQSVTAELEGLGAGVSYHFRVLAENETGPVAGEEQVFTTRGTGPFELPDGREWELVSPPQKEGALILRPGDEAPIQAAADGAAIAYATNLPTEAQPSGNPGSTQVLATRGPQGWSSADLALPHTEPTGINSAPGQEDRVFSEDLSLAVVQPFGPFDPSLSGEASEQTAFLRNDATGVYTPLVTGCPSPTEETAGHPCSQLVREHANVPAGTRFAEGAGCVPKPHCGPEFVAGTPNLSDIVLNSPVALTQTAPAAPEGGLYESSAGRLQLVSVLPLDEAEELENKEAEETERKTGLPGSIPKKEGLPAKKPVLGNEEPDGDARDAISKDGSRVFWTVEGRAGDEGRPLYVRDTATGSTLLIAPDGEYQSADNEGTRMFFTEDGDLYECALVEQAGGLTCDLSDLAPSGEVLGGLLPGTSEDGSWVYFVANNGVLAHGGVQGACVKEVPAEDRRAYIESLLTSCNLYVRHDGVTKLVAVLGGSDAQDWALELVNLTARVSPNGEWLAFMSARGLTGYDNADASSGEPDEEVYLYNGATERLVCASCNPTGARPHGVQYGVADHEGMPLAGGNDVWNALTWLAANIPGWSPFAGQKETVYQPRYLSDSGRLFFDSRDGLVPKDHNEAEDVYEYEPAGVPAGEHACSAASASGSDVFEPERTAKVEGREVTSGAGCVALISSGESAQESAFLDASAGDGDGEHGEPGSEAGRDVFFMTTAKLAPQDIDNAYDVYDAQECTTSAPCPVAPAEQPPACTTEASCKAAPSPQPEIFGPPASQTFSGPGDAPPPPPLPVAKPKPKPTKCHKGFVKNHKGKCVRKKAKKRAKRSSTNRETRR